MKANNWTNKKNAMSFIQRLAGCSRTTLQFYIYNDANKELTYRPNTFAGNIEEGKIYQNLRFWNKRGAGVFVAINERDVFGIVVGIRALFLDLDKNNISCDSICKLLRPHLVVQTSPRKFHVYWRVHNCNVHDFPSFQQAIAEKFDGNRTVIDPGIAMRLPGFLHCKQLPFRAELVNEYGGKPYSVSEVFKKLGVRYPTHDVAMATWRKFAPPQETEKPAAASEVTAGGSEQQNRLGNINAPSIMGRDEQRPAQIPYPGAALQQHEGFYYLSGDERGFFLTLFLHYGCFIEVGGRVPDDPVRVCRLLRVSTEQWGEFRKALLSLGLCREEKGYLVSDLFREAYEAAQGETLSET